MSGSLHPFSSLELFPACVIECAFTNGREYDSSLRSGNKKALFFVQMSRYLWIESDFVGILIVVWEPYLNSTGETEQPASVLFFYGIPLRERSCFFCMISLKMMRLKPEHHHLSTLTLKCTFLGEGTFCFQVHLHYRRLGVHRWGIVHFPLDKLHDGLKVKRALLSPKQDITLFFFFFFLFVKSC